MASGGSFICVEAVGRRRGGSDKELKRTLQKPAPSWTVLGKYYASIVSGYRAWKAILRSSHKSAIKGTDETYNQSNYVRSGGYLRALQDFYSLKPSHVQYFQRNNMVFGNMGTIGERTVILQGKVKHGLPSKPTMRVFKTDKDGSDDTKHIITYIE